MNLKVLNAFFHHDWHWIFWPHGPENIWFYLGWCGGMECDDKSAWVYHTAAQYPTANWELIRAPCCCRWNKVIHGNLEPETRANRDSIASVWMFRLTEDKLLSLLSKEEFVILHSKSLVVGHFQGKLIQWFSDIRMLFSVLLCLTCWPFPGFAWLRNGCWCSSFDNLTYILLRWRKVQFLNVLLIKEENFSWWSLADFHSQIIG